MRFPTKVFLILLWTLNVYALKAETFPSKPIRWVVTSPAGDGGDVTGRLIADKLSKVLSQPITIDNKPGAGGVIGSEIVAKATPDGYTMVVGNAGSHSITPALYKNLNYDPVNDFTAVGLFCTAPNVMVVNPNLHLHSVTEFINFAKKQGQSLNYGSGGIGSSVKSTRAPSPRHTLCGGRPRLRTGTASTMTSALPQSTTNSPMS